MPLRNRNDVDEGVWVYGCMEFMKGLNVYVPVHIMAMHGSMILLSTHTNDTIGLGGWNKLGVEEE